MYEKSARSIVITTPTKIHSHKSICLVVAIFYLQWPVNTLPWKLCKGTRGNAITDPQSHPIHSEMEWDWGSNAKGLTRVASRMTFHIFKKWNASSIHSYPLLVG